MKPLLAEQWSFFIVSSLIKDLIGHEYEILLNFPNEIRVG